MLQGIWQSRDATSSLCRQCILVTYHLTAWLFHHDKLPVYLQAHGKATGTNSCQRWSCAPC